MQSHLRFLWIWCQNFICCNSAYNFKFLALTLFFIHLYSCSLCIYYGHIVDILTNHILNACFMKEYFVFFFQSAVFTQRQCLTKKSPTCLIHEPLRLEGVTKLLYDGLICVCYVNPTFSMLFTT